MRILHARVSIALATGAVFALPAVARAAELPNSINTPPSGAGTEQVNTAGHVVARPGIESTVGIGSGFTDTYGLGLSGRVGYTTKDAIYVGGAVQYFFGRSVNDTSSHATFVGGEGGYKFFPVHQVEVRPYVFVGPAFITQVSDNPFTKISTTDLAVQPGVIGMYHFGDAFIGADAHAMVTPSPNTLAVLASGGFGF